MREIWQHPGWNDIPLLVLYSNDDQYTPPSVNKVDMVRSWERVHGAAEPRIRGLFKLLSLADHEINDARSNHQTRIPPLASTKQLTTHQGSGRHGLASGGLSKSTI